jgi:predicted RNA binding protein YcfA (HicA-like mRNA interferase family)
MAALPVLSGRKAVRVFEKRGWQVARQRGEIATLSIPDHKEIAKGTLRSLIRAAGMTVEEFTEQL